MSRVVFGPYGRMVHFVVRHLTFVTFVGVLASLTVYYFNLRLDGWTIASDTGGCGLY